MFVLKLAKILKGKVTKVDRGSRTFRREHPTSRHETLPRGPSQRVNSEEPDIVGKDLLGRTQHLKKEEKETKRVGKKKE